MLLKHRIVLNYSQIVYFFGTLTSVLEGEVLFCFVFFSSCFKHGSMPMFLIGIQFQ